MSGSASRPAPHVDIIVFGATGFTGRLVAAHLSTYARTGLRLGLAGRNASRLASVRDELLNVSAELIVANALRASDMEAMARQARVIVSTVGPYTLYGSALVAACAAAGTDYVDLAGEVLWEHEMISRHADAARRSGARLVSSCGYDSVPADIATLLLQREAQMRLGRPASAVHGFVLEFVGGLSGGTLAAAREEIKRELTRSALAGDPYALALADGALTGHPPAQPPPPAYSALFAAWTTPAFSADIDRPIIYRTNALLTARDASFAYGAAFSFDERQVLAPGLAGWLTAQLSSRLSIVLYSPLLQSLLPQPGEGPSRALREAGYYEELFVAPLGDGSTLVLALHGDMDPGYGSTAKIVGEAALCLLYGDPKEPTAPGGFHTPASAMGGALATRLALHAGVTFNLTTMDEAALETLRRPPADGAALIVVVGVLLVVALLGACVWCCSRCCCKCFHGGGARGKRKCSGRVGDMI